MLFSSSAARYHFPVEHRIHPYHGFSHRKFEQLRQSSYSLDLHRKQWLFSSPFRKNCRLSIPPIFWVLPRLMISPYSKVSLYGTKGAPSHLPPYPLRGSLKSHLFYTFIRNDCRFQFVMYLEHNHHVFGIWRASSSMTHDNHKSSNRTLDSFVNTFYCIRER